MAIKGLENVLGNLNKAISGIEGATHKGLLAAGTFIKGESQEITPVEFGVLLNSAFVRPVGPMRVVVGYTALYAAWVHEFPEFFNYTKPGTGPKFLERAIKNNIPQILSIIQRRAKV